MKLHALLAIGLAAGIAACATDDNAAPATQSASDKNAEWQHSAFIDHMHAHADYLDELNYALDDGDLERAKIPAYWLSRHKTVGGLPKDLQPYLKHMRKAAQDVGAAKDLDTAQAAAQRIASACRSCHTAAGVTVQK